MAWNQGSGEVPPERVERVRELQREWFGRPLTQLFGSVLDVCAITQAELAGHLGISPAMVSQLMTGRREKPGNPPVQDRILELGRALDRFEAGEIAAEGLAATLQSLGGSTAMRSSVAYRAHNTSALDPTGQAQFVRNLFASVASADELVGAADVLQQRYPELAEILRVYGLGRTSEAAAHLQSHRLS